MSDTVKVFDPDTQRTVTIPARELAPGMIPTQTIDEDGRVTGGIVWVPADALRQSTELRHPPLPELRPLLERFATLFPSQHGTAEEWEIDFRNAWNFASEVLLWAHAADVFERLTAGRALCDEKKRDIGEVIASCLSCDAEAARFIARPATVTKKRQEEIIAAFFCEDDDVDPTLNEGMTFWESWRTAHPDSFPTRQLDEALSAILQRYIRRRLQPPAT
jgi:hypothetical protein